MKPTGIACASRLGIKTQEEDVASERTHLDITTCRTQMCSALQNLDSHMARGSRIMRQRAAQNSALQGLRPAVQSPQFERIRFRLDPSQYLPQRHNKDLIVLHFTAGNSSESAYRTWQADPKRIGTAYGVDPDGAIVEFFPPEAWAYHLGIKGTRHHDQRSIGIEIANVGPLRPDPEDPNQLNWWPRNWGTRYCHRSQTDRYVTCDYRGISAFASMPQPQIEATGLLVRHLCDEFGIPKVACQASRRGEHNPAVFAHYQGVASHSNFRQDKWDVGPAFNWDCLGF